MTHQISRLLALVAIVLAAVGALGAPAFAHAGLKSSDPKDGSTVKELISSIELVFTEDINARYTTVVVTGPGGAKVADGKPQVKGDTVTQELKPDLADGRYAIAFRVISADGHPVAEELHFTLKVPAPEATPTAENTAGASASPEQSMATPLPSSADPVSATPAAASSTSDGGAAMPTVLLVVGALVLVAGVAVFVAGRRRPTRQKA
ncbi:copper resistance CopC family protein [Nonomuraea cypriaca]|uniref:copper resistance CopC family protein n=1 Tax=Nonomuraea cypriaca TaxID=1187855 RepID=UPI0018A815D1|nr:copper resistance CopC family protein [Nonomuraea cypriaca]